ICPPLIQIYATQEYLTLSLATGIGTPQCPGIIPSLCLDPAFVVGKHGAGTLERRGEFLPLAGGCLAFHQGSCRPVTVAGIGDKRLISGHLATAGDDVASTPSDYCGGLVIVDMVEDTTTRIDIAPEVQSPSCTDLTHAGNQCFWIEGFGYVVTP